MACLQGVLLCDSIDGLGSVLNHRRNQVRDAMVGGEVFRAGEAIIIIAHKF